MDALSARRAALLALRKWRRQNHLADAVLASVLAGNDLSVPDRGFAQELFYGVVRQLRLLDFWIEQLRSAALHDDIKDLVRLGCYQLFILGVPEHAAVYETVQLAPPRARGLVNAMLRSAMRQWDELQKLTRSQPLAVRLSHPDFMVERWEKVFGAAATAELCAWNNRTPSLYARINTLKTTPSLFLEQHPEASPLATRPGFVEFTGLLPLQALKAGECYMQDPSTALSCELLRPQKGEIILDACAAPGGKASLLAAMMQNEGTIIACDREPDRLSVLKQNMETLGVRIAHMASVDWISGTLSERAFGNRLADRILVDAPCSNTGVMRRRVDVRWRLQPGEFLRMQKQQVSIVRSATRFLKPGGVLVYSTCSLEPEENGEVTRQLLANLPLRLEEEKVSLPFQDGFDGAYAARLIRCD